MLGEPLVLPAQRPASPEMAESPTLTTVGFPTPGPSASAGVTHSAAAATTANATDTTFLMTRPPMIARVPCRTDHYHARARRCEFWQASHMPGPPVILPPFTEESALRKVQVAQDAWNTRDPERVALAYTEDSQWRNRDEFFTGREAISASCARKWARELDYLLRKELWCVHGNRISVRFEYESHDADGQWWRSHGNEHWEFDEDDRAHAPPRREHQRLPHRSQRAADRDGLTAQARPRRAGGRRGRGR